MPNCCVIGCKLKKGQDQPTLTMHRLPRCKERKNKWLEAIGIENIRQGVKDIFICSQHFDKNAFNRTLTVVRLQEDAVPSGPLPQSDNQDNSVNLKFEEDRTYLLMEQSDYSQAADESPDSAAASIYNPEVSEFPIKNKKIRKIKLLEHKCQEQRKKIRRLNQVIRRQNKKIADFRNIIKDLLESNLLDSDSCPEKQTFQDNDMILEEEQYLDLQET